MDSPTVEDLIWRAVEDERKRGPAGLSFAPVYSFVTAVVHMSRGQERQSILDALIRTRPEGKSAEWNAGFDEALSAAIRILVERSHTH
jgi:hypothetical protein